MSNLEKSQKKSQNVSKNGTSKKRQKYFCKICDYNTSNKTDYNKHISTKKHGTKWYMYFKDIFEDVKIEKPYFSCEKCAFLSCDIDDFNTHVISHHKIPEKVANCDFFSEVKKAPLKNEKKNESKKYICDFCGKIYKYHSGYYRHLKKCKGEQISTNNKLLDFVMETQSQLMENQEKTRELCNEIIKLKDTNKIINNNTYNQSVNINLFLNEECKNAMNLTDFINKVQMTLTDLAYTTNNGMIKGMTNIVIKNLEDTPPTKRPIHSIQDKDGSQLYIKEDDTWGCKNKKEKLEKTITSISKKQCGLIKEWEKHHPDWNKSEEETSQYMEICRIIMGGTTDMELEKTRDLILKSIPVTDVSTVENN